MREIQAIKQRFGIIGHSIALDQALHTAIKVANTDLTVLITGESGTGKEVFSRIIHSNSARKHNKFIAINCGAIPKGTINSELFGHEKGSFTGAAGERKGYFETCPANKAVIPVPPPLTHTHSLVLTTTYTVVIKCTAGTVR